MNVKQIREVVEKQFSKRSTLLGLWQEIAENFYPERADFVLKRTIGTDFAEHLSTTYPVMCRRELGDQFSSMLRPTQKQWFHMVPADSERETNEAKRWLEWAEKVQRRAMYDKHTKFQRAMKEADHDLASFGSPVTSLRLNRNADALLYRCWHLRDVIWIENEEGDICLVARKWNPFAYELVRMFGDKNHQSTKDEATRNPFAEFECLHIVCQADMFDLDSKGRPYVSIYLDCTHDHTLEQVPVWANEYMVSRWQTVSGSQYAFSPATIVALPDARMLQSMAYTLLEAGEKLTNPPIIATENVVKSDVAIYAGGITWIDEDYDERLGDALRPMPQDAKGMPIGIDMMRDSREMLARAFFLNKLNLPLRDGGPEMTAYEVGQRVQEYIRGAMPLFQPLEDEYNGQICEATFNLLLRAGTFGDPRNMPKILQGAEIEFRFESPLHDAIEEQKGQKFLEAKQLIVSALDLDRTSGALLDAKKALRDALAGVQVPTEWINDETTVQDIVDEQEQLALAAQQLAAAQQGSEAAVNIGQAAKAFSEAGQT